MDFDVTNVVTAVVTAVVTTILNIASMVFTKLTDARIASKKDKSAREYQEKKDKSARAYQERRQIYLRLTEVFDKWYYDMTKENGVAFANCQTIVEIFGSEEAIREVDGIVKAAKASSHEKMLTHYTNLREVMRKELGT